jgi:hypothetical protein
MMYGELYQYFIQNRQLDLPGIGVFHLERKPAVSDFPNRIINPPSYHIELQQSSAAPSKRFFSRLAAMTGSSERDAVIRFNDFVFDLKQQLSNGQTIKWDGVGVLSPGLGGTVNFDPDINGYTSERPVKAVKVIREKAEHTVRVGEDEKTAAQMIELLNQPEEKRKYWWAWPLIIGLIVIMFLGWYFSVYGLQVGATGNKQKVNASEPAPAYKTP